MFFLRSTPARQAAPAATCTGFSARDWNELFEHWHRDRAQTLTRVVGWRERREVGQLMHPYPPDERVCRGGRNTVAAARA